MRPPSNLTDAELDEAVARECFGWMHLTKGEAANCGDILLPHHCTTIIGEKCIWADRANNVVLRECCDDRRWQPTSDARDAERVWNWIARSIDQITISRGNQESEDDNDIVWLAIPGERAGWRVKRPSWKRALCEAALMVARRGN